MIVPAGEERIRGGVAKRYRYDAVRDAEIQRSLPPRTADEYRMLYAAAANELIRRTAEAHWPAKKSMVDADLWVDPEVWREIQERISQAAIDLHAAARPARSPGAIRTSTTIAMFEMADGR